MLKCYEALTLLEVAMSSYQTWGHVCPSLSLSLVCSFSTHRLFKTSLRIDLFVNRSIQNSILFSFIKLLASTSSICIEYIYMQSPSGKGSLIFRRCGPTLFQSNFDDPNWSMCLKHVSKSPHVESTNDHKRLDLSSFS